MTQRNKSVILLSGGLDSAANLALCRLQDEPVLALTVDYGQRAAARELRAAEALARHFEVPHARVELRWLGALGGSSLTESRGTVPELSVAELDDAGVTVDSARSVWVPNRNGVLINMASSYAERHGAIRVVVGFNREEAATFPDNSGPYLEAASAALFYSTANHVRIACYTTHLDKREIVAELRQAVPDFPFHLVWSCYHGGEQACGRCESCRRFTRALGKSYP